MRRSLLALAFVLIAATVRADDAFERAVRPLFLERCVKCHGPDKQKGSLRLDSARAFAQGGATGPAVVPGKPVESPLLKAIRHDGDLKMPPDGKLTAKQIGDVEAWIKGGAAWPADAPGAKTEPVPTKVQPLAPDAMGLRPALQAWYRADTLPLADGKPVHVWPDSSGNGRDLTQTLGVRVGGVGTAPTFASNSRVRRRPAVRFEVGNGLATSPARPVDLRGDASVTISLVVNLTRHTANPPFDGILGIGDPANPGHDPGRAHALLVQIRRTGKPELQLAGGWNHDADVGSFEPLYDRAVLLTFVKRPGPMRSTTRAYIDGRPLDPAKFAGRDTVPEFRHRDDIGLYLGRALEWSGHIKGDVAEVAIWNRALTDAEREGVEANLAEKYGLFVPSMAGPPAAFTAAERDFWAFQPVQNATPPIVANSNWPTSPIDRFVLAKLEAMGLNPNPPTDRRVWLRRVTFDLTGLPPTPDASDSFESDTSARAFERVVDRLLASPQYGERWGRHWLDVVRYAETTANDANAVLRYAWRYRDAVIRSFNVDQPFDQFVREQIAGDLMPTLSDPSAALDRVASTGFLMVGPKALAETDKEQSKLDVIDDQIDTIGRAFLGLTIACARCHDHKFDPVRTSDYYALAGILRGTDVFRDEVRNASMWQEWTYHPPGGVPVALMAPKDGMPINLRVHLRGNRFTLGPTAPRGFPGVVGRERTPLTTEQSGRLELADWIASKDNPLTARVMVNRIWQHHFGVGLVATSDNFGNRGDRPSHPELLDWLAARFVESGWSVKSLHRDLVLSATYHQSSAPTELGMKRDPNNHWLWRMPLRRLDAEAIRDAMLAASGRLDLTPGGPETGEFLYGRGEVIDKNRDFFRPNQVKADDPVFATSRKRSVYLPVIRNAVPDVLALFDGADPNGVTAVRNDTTVPSQALFLMNHPFVRDQAKAFAERLAATPGTDNERIALGYRLALGRGPTTNESETVRRFLKDRPGAWVSFCQTLLCRNEFLYVD